MQDRVAGHPIALVTGASSGIGRAVAEQLAAEGHDVIVHFGGNAAGAEETARRVRALGRRAAAISIPLQGLGSGDDFWVPAAEALGAWGATGLDVLVLNAGIDDRAEFSEVSAERIRAIFDVNVIAPTLIMQQAPARMARDSAVVFVSSIAATDPIPDSIPYSASKAALNTLARANAERLKPQGIRVNVVAPGAVDTPLQAEANRERLRSRGVLGSPEEIAEAVVFLATKRSRWVNAQVLRAAGPLL